jgi:hypothetical protein
MSNLMFDQASLLFEVRLKWRDVPSLWRDTPSSTDSSSGGISTPDTYSSR